MRLAITIFLFTLIACTFVVRSKRAKWIGKKSRCLDYNEIDSCCDIGLAMSEIRQRYKGSSESLRRMGCEV